MIIPLLLSTILALTPVWESKSVHFSWESKGEGYVYEFETYKDWELTNLYFKLPPITKTYIDVVYHDSGKYYQRIKYYNPNTPEIYSYWYLGQFYLNLQEGILSEDGPENPPPIEDEPENEPENEIEQDDEVNTPNENTQETLEQIKFQLPTIPDSREKIADIFKKEDTQTKKEIDNSDICKISVFKNEETKIKEWNCNINIEVSAIKYIDWDKYYSLEIQGKYPKSIKAEIQIYECKKFSITDINTWNKCKEVLTDTYTGDINLIYFGKIYANNKAGTLTNFNFTDSEFQTRSTFVNDISKQDVKVYFSIYSQFKSKEWIDLTYTTQKSITIPTAVKAAAVKPFSFPLSKLIGVTQWHGCTQYQCPHKGIDFGARLHNVIAVGDGTVADIGFDKYGGECNQGGRYIIVKHTNGMYSAYIHLDSFLVKKGNSVKKGQVIGISGNSGMKNCQPLGYHLHFETRKGLSSSTHTDPVKYVNVDWNLIPTLQYKQFPGRLTGDNPHPNF